MKKRSGIFISLLLAGTLALAGCGNKQPKLSGDEAKEALNNAEKLYFTGNLSDVNTYSNISADDKTAGYVEESGFVTKKYTVSVDKKVLFYIVDEVKDYESDDPSVVSSTTWEYFDADGKCLGYAQERYIDSEYRIVFLDSAGKLKEYHTDENSQIIYNNDNEQIGTVTSKLSHWYGKGFYIQIDTPKSDTDIALYDKIAMYMKNVTWVNDKYRDLDD